MKGTEDYSANTKHASLLFYYYYYYLVSYLTKLIFFNVMLRQWRLRLMCERSTLENVIRKSVNAVQLKISPHPKSS